MSLVALEIQTFNVSITTERCLTKYFKFWQHLPKDILYIRTLYVWLLQQSSRHLLHHWHSILKSPEMREDEKSINIIFSLNEAVGALAEALRIFKVSNERCNMFYLILQFEEHNVNLLHIESRSSVRVPGYEFIVEVFQCRDSVPVMTSLVTRLILKWETSRELSR